MKEEDENGGRRRGINGNWIKTLKPAADRSMLIVGVSRRVHSSFRICESERKLTKPMQEMRGRRRAISSSTFTRSLRYVAIKILR